MYMGVILCIVDELDIYLSAPHVYGGDPLEQVTETFSNLVLPMYMGVIPNTKPNTTRRWSAPHVYGGDPWSMIDFRNDPSCSPCIWG